MGRACTRAERWLRSTDAATAQALEAQRRRKEEEARQAAEAAQQAAQKNAAFEAERLQNYLNGKARLDAALQNSGLSEAERQAVQAQARSKGLGAGLGRLAAAAEGVRQSAQAAEQRAARKEEKLDAQMKSLTAKPQEWKAAAQAYLTPKAFDAFRAQERSSASLPAAGEEQSAGKSQPKSWWQRAGDWIADRLDDAAETIQSGWDAFRVRHLKFTKLEDGYISVRAETPPGTRMDYRRTVAEVMNSDADKFFGGTRYNPETIAARTSGGLLRSAVSKGSLVLAGLTSLASNLWTFGTNPAEGETFWDRTVRNREFWVSTAVDFAVSVAVGVAAAAVVAGVIAAAPLFSASAVALIATPAVAIGGTALTGIAIGGAVDATGFPNMAKSWLNGLFSGG